MVKTFLGSGWENPMLLLMELLVGKIEGRESVLEAWEGMSVVDYDEGDSTTLHSPILDEFNLELIDANGEAVKFPIRFVCDPKFHKVGTVLDAGGKPTINEMPSCDDLPAHK